MQAASVSVVPAAEGDRLVFSASGPDSFGAYHDLYDSGTSVSRTDGLFRAAVTAHRFPRMLLFERKVAGAAHHRTVERVRRDGFDHINLQLLRRGSMAAGEPGHERALSPGNIIVFDTTRPQRTVVAQADYLSVAITREAITTVLPDVRGLHGSVLSNGAAGLLGDFLLSLARHVGSLTPQLASESAAVVGTLLQAAVAGERPCAVREDDLSVAETHRWRADAYIDAHLHDRALDVAAVAAGIGVARTTLYAAFASRGGVARRILDRRVKRLSEALLRPAEARSVSALAFDLGFADESHCSRAFKARFGCPPGQFRAASRHARASPSPVPAADGWADWWGGIA